VDVDQLVMDDDVKRSGAVRRWNYWSLSLIVDSHFHFFFSLYFRENRDFLKKIVKIGEIFFLL
jgi:hypothetical protein